MNYYNCKDLPVWAQILLHPEPTAAQDEPSAAPVDDQMPGSGAAAA